MCTGNGNAAEQRSSEDDDNGNPNSGKSPRNRAIGNGQTLSYKPLNQQDGKIVIKITPEDIKTSDDYRSNAPVGYVLGDALHEKLMDNSITTVWNFVKKPQILYNDGVYYVYQFELMEDRTEVLQEGPYAYHNKPFILKPWTVEFLFDKEAITTISLWENLLELPVRYWSIEALRKLSSAMGKPLYTDKYTTDINHISCARVMVAVDISRPLTEAIEIEAP
ncbi:hypothetical protein P3S68_015535 [Capsicum galapagoense]